MKINAAYLKSEADRMGIVPERMNPSKCAVAILCLSNNYVSLTCKEKLQLEAGFEGWWTQANPFSKYFREGRKFAKMCGY